jgi:hypothetical protein
MTAGVAVGSSVITALITYPLAVRRYVSEHWWESRRRAYDAVMEGLGEIRMALNDVCEEHASGEMGSPATITAMNRWMTAAEKVDKIDHQGGYKLSKETHYLLEELRLALRLPKGENENEWLLNTVGAVKVATTSIGIEARCALGVMTFRERLAYWNAKRKARP